MAATPHTFSESRAACLLCYNELSIVLGHLICGTDNTVSVPVMTGNCDTLTVCSTLTHTKDGLMLIAFYTRRPSGSQVATNGL